MVDQNPSVQRVLVGEFQSFLSGQCISAFVEQEAGRIKDDAQSSLANRVAIAKALVTTKAASVAEACSIVVDGGLNIRGLSVDSCRAALDCLTAFGDEAREPLARFELMVSEKFPLVRDWASEE